MSYRTNVVERDFSGFVQPQIAETGAIVVISQKGRNDKPILCQSEKDVLTNFGNPNATYASVFEAIAFCRTAPCYVISAIGDNALYGGVAIKESSVESLVSGVASVDSYTFSDNSISHILFASSPWDSNLRVNIISKGGKKFKTTLYERAGNTDIYLSEYEYSLDREKDNFGNFRYQDETWGFASNRVRALCVGQWIKNSVAEVSKLLITAFSGANVGVLSGYMFEEYAHNFLAKGDVSSCKLICTSNPELTKEGLKIEKRKTGWFSAPNWTTAFEKKMSDLGEGQKSTTAFETFLMYQCIRSQDSIQKLL
jgi:hypothetical protein